jgi:dipeptidyl aminopeptidase/acylaminoacyl peptidase
MQPSFSPDGERLAYISDDDGWWHLHVRNLETGRTTQLTEGEFEMGGPAWVQGQRFFQWTPDGRELVARRNQHGTMDLLRVGLDGSVTELNALDRYDTIMQPTVSQTGRVAFVGSAPDQPARVVSWADGESPAVRRRSADERIPADAFSQVRDVSWTADGGQEVHGQYYPPTNPDFESTGKPPAIVMVHGGPTSQRTAAFEERSQFFATRGFAVIDVNYRGSTGYGRDYREALLGDWGIKDVEDVLSARQWLADQGLADPDRCVVMGSSAGGYTVLRTLCSQPGTFAGGISMYGISNLFELALDTHKFEARYGDRLLGELPEDSDVYRERSPLFHADDIKDPVAVFQGGEDKVVPQAQAEAIVDSLASRGVPHEYHLYEDEGHGWRKPETIEHFYGACVDFLRKHVIFG